MTDVRATFRWPEVRIPVEYSPVVFRSPKRCVQDWVLAGIEGELGLGRRACLGDDGRICGQSEASEDGCDHRWVG